MGSGGTGSSFMKVRQAAVLLATFLGGYTSVTLSFVVEQMCRTAHKRVERKLKKKLKRFHKWWLANPKKNTAGRRQPASTQPVQSAMSPLVRSPYSGERHWPSPHVDIKPHFRVAPTQALWRPSRGRWCASPAASQHYDSTPTSGDFLGVANGAMRSCSSATSHKPAPSTHPRFDALPQTRQPATPARMACCAFVRPRGGGGPGCTA